jgi:uncharacterized membrane protein
MRKLSLNKSSRELLQPNDLKRSSKRPFSTRGDLQISLKSWFILILALLILVDIFIALDIPFLRPICGFLFFTTIPGLLILYTLKLPKIGYLKTGVLAVGLSLLFLILVGLLFNVVCSAVGIANPLSIPYMLTSLSFVLLLLAVAAYRLNRTDRPFVTIPNLASVNTKNSLPLLLIPSLFPFLAVFGTYVMNTQQNNSILLALLLLIPSYVVALVILQRRRNIAAVVFPVTILMISIALLLAHGLTSDYLVGADVQGEYLAYQQVVNSQHWTFLSNQVSVTTLGTSLLPAVYQLITGISGFYMFKLVFQLIFSVTPLVVYIIAKKYLTTVYAFLASFLFMAQLQFIANIQSAVREEVALLFLALAFLVLLADDVELGKERRTLLFFLFASGAILTHYTTGGVLILVLLIAYGIAVAVAGYYRFAHRDEKTIAGFYTFTHRDDEKKSVRPAVTFMTIVLLFVIFFFWYNQLAQTTNVIVFFRVTVEHFSEFFNLESRAPGVLASVGQNAVSSLPRQVRAYTYDLLYLIIGIGVFAIFLKRESEKYGTSYASLALASVILIALWLAIPYLSIYGILRLFQLLLVLLVVPFFIGVGVILKSLKIKRQRYCVAAVLLILLVQYACSALLLDQALGIPSSIDLNRSGASYNTFYFYSQEVIAAQWLKNNMVETDNVTADSGGGLVRLALAGFQSSNVTTFGGYTSGASYIYLYYANLRGDFGFSTVSNSTKLVTATGYTPGDQVSDFSGGMSKIYENGKATIYG